MSYTNTTTHYSWPLPEETDLFNGLDDNQMKEELDTKIYTLEQRSSGDHEAVEALTARVTEVEQTVGGYDDEIEALQGTVNEHAERLINLTNRQTELSRRLNGKAGESTIALEYNEEESYLVGDFVYHNNILYKAINASATPAGDFDADDWDIVILTNELGGSTPTPGTIAAANVTYNDVLTQLGVNNAQDAIVALKTLIDNIGGNSMPILNFATPVKTFVASDSYTAQEGDYLHIAFYKTDTSSGSTQINVDGTPVSKVEYLANIRSTCNASTFRLKAGSVVTTDNNFSATSSVFILREVSA